MQSDCFKIPEAQNMESNRIFKMTFKKLAQGL